MKNILNQLDNAILIVNHSGIIQFANTAALNLFNFTSSQVNGVLINHLLKLDPTKLAFYLDKPNTLTEALTISASSKSNCYIEVSEQVWYQSDCYMIIVRIRRKEITAQLLQQFIDELPFSVWLQNDQRECIYMNEAHIKCHQEFFPELETFSPKYNLENALNYINNPDWIHKIWDEESHNQFVEDIIQARQSKQPIINEQVFHLGDKTKTIQNHLIPLYNIFNNKSYLGCISRDITFNKKLQEVGIKHVDELARLKKLLYASHHASDYITSMFSKLKSAISQELDTDHISLWIYEPENHRVQYVYDQNILFPDLVDSSSYPISSEEIKQICNSSYINKLLPLEKRRDLAQYSRLKEKNIGFIGTYEIKNELDNTIFGFLNVLYHKDKPPSLHQEYLIQNTCKQLDLLLQNNVLLAHIHEDYIKREKIQNELEAFLSTTVDLTAIINFKTGQFIKVNDQWEQLLGWTSKELVGKMCLQDLEHDAYHELSLQNLAALTLEGNLHKCKTKCRMKDGSYKLLQWNYKRLEGEDLAVFTAKDITEKEKLKIQKKQLEDAIHLESLINEFFANISHELRTPLNIIIATIQLLDSTDLLSDTCAHNADKYIKSMKQNAFRLLKLINNIIDITRIDAGYYNVKLGNYNIVSLVENVADSTIQYMHAKDIEFTFDTEIEEEYIACDPDLIERIILNLLSNSIKYNNGHETNMIWITITLEDDCVVISIKDNGIGIPEEKLNAIFERFIQVDNTLTRKQEGSGIGLSLVKSLVEMQNGQISVKSQLGKGSEFIIKLPRQTVIEDTSYNSPSPANNISSEKYIIEFSDITN